MTEMLWCFKHHEHDEEDDEIKFESDEGHLHKGGYFGLKENGNVETSSAIL